MLLMPAQPLRAVAAPRSARAGSRSGRPGRGERKRILSFEAGGGGLLGPWRASEMLRRRSEVRRSGLSPRSHQAGRWGGVVKQGGGHFQPAGPPPLRSRPTVCARCSAGGGARSRAAMAPRPFWRRRPAGRPAGRGPRRAAAAGRAAASCGATASPAEGAEGAEGVQRV